jgi:hypothetical protein
MDLILMIGGALMFLAGVGVRGKKIMANKQPAAQAVAEIKKVDPLKNIGEAEKSEDKK